MLSYRLNQGRLLESSECHLAMVGLYQALDPNPPTG